VRPGCVANELAEEQRRGGRASELSSQVRDIRDLRVELLAVLLLERRTSLFGFPGTMVLSQEAARAAADTEDERKAFEGAILPKMIVAGFATVTITSVIVTGIIASGIGT